MQALVATLDRDGDPTNGGAGAGPASLSPGQQSGLGNVSARVSFVGGALTARGRHPKKADTENKGAVSSTKGKNVLVFFTRSTCVRRMPGV